jgi:aryl-alcohol dehydrogenase-like predicted oxidoreductase
MCAFDSTTNQTFIVIPGTTKIKNLEENVAAGQIQLTKGEEKEIQTACEQADVVGGRYPDAMKSLLFGDSAPKKN